MPCVEAEITAFVLELDAILLFNQVCGSELLQDICDIVGCQGFKKVEGRRFVGSFQLEDDSCGDDCQQQEKN